MVEGWVLLLFLSRHLHIISKERTFLVWNYIMPKNVRSLQFFLLLSHKICHHILLLPLYWFCLKTFILMCLLWHFLKLIFLLLLNSQNWFLCKRNLTVNLTAAKNKMATKKETGYSVAREFKLRFVYKAWFSNSSIRKTEGWL